MSKNSSNVSPNFSSYSLFYRSQNPATYIAGLDGLRAISVVIVVIAHSGFGNLVPGGFGVTLFFFISGFLITNLLISEWAEGNLNLKNFYIRRYLRLSPELFIYALVGTIINIIFFDVRLVDVAAAIFYFTNYLNIFAISHVSMPFKFGHFWSLAVEEHFYLLAPLIMVSFGQQLKRYTTVIVVICLAIPFYRWFASISFFPEHLTGTASAYTYYASEARLDSILYGCLLAMLVRFHLARLPALTSGQALVVLTTAAIALAASFLFRDYHFRSVWRYSVQGIALGAIFYAIYFSQIGGRIIKILELPAISFLGRMSYGIYIWHLVPVFAFEHLLNLAGFSESLLTRFACAVVALSTSTAIASVSAKYVLGAVTVWRRRFGSGLHGIATQSQQVQSRIN